MKIKQFGFYVWFIYLFIALVCGLLISCNTVNKVLNRKSNKTNTHTTTAKDNSYLAEKTVEIFKKDTSFKTTKKDSDFEKETTIETETQILNDSVKTVKSKTVIREKGKATQETKSQKIKTKTAKEATKEAVTVKQSEDKKEAVTAKETAKEVEKKKASFWVFVVIGVIAFYIIEKLFKK